MIFLPRLRSDRGNSRSVRVGPRRLLQRERWVSMPLRQIKVGRCPGEKLLFQGREGRSVREGNLRV